MVWRHWGDSGQPHPCHQASSLVTYGFPPVPSVPGGGGPASGAKSECLGGGVAQEECHLEVGEAQTLGTQVQGTFGAAKVEEGNPSSLDL